ncbi:MAG: hypothetical protein ACR2F6_17365 [Mycobacteriales bacterium]
MITAVEGPSAAGKTTWWRHNAREFVEECAPTGSEPDESDQAARAALWVDANAARRKAALTPEARTGSAICDGDPVKLHYSWCLTRIGARPPARFEMEPAATRRAFVAERLGLADLVLISIPSAATLRKRRESDLSRRRRGFDLHVRLGEPLRKWYQAVDSVDPGSDVGAPPDGPPRTITKTRRARSDPTIIDEIVGRLPRRG